MAISPPTSSLPPLSRLPSCSLKQVAEAVENLRSIYCPQALTTLPKPKALPKHLVHDTTVPDSGHASEDGDDEPDDEDDPATEGQHETRGQRRESAASTPAVTPGPVLGDHLGKLVEERNGEDQREGRREAPTSSSSRKLSQSGNVHRSKAQVDPKTAANETESAPAKSDYDLRSLHSLAMKGVKY